MATTDVELVRAAWAAVGRGDVDELHVLLDPHVRWYGVGDPDGGCLNRDQALAYIKRELDAGVTAFATDIRDAGAHVLATVQAHDPHEPDAPREPHGELVTVRDGKIVEIVVYPEVASAVAAAGGQGTS